jgi:hypothetical protein
VPRLVDLAAIHSCNLSEKDNAKETISRTWISCDVHPRQALWTIVPVEVYTIAVRPAVRCCLAWRVIFPHSHVTEAAGAIPSLPFLYALAQRRRTVPSRWEHRERKLSVVDNVRNAMCEERATIGELTESPEKMTGLGRQISASVQQHNSSRADR